MSAAWSIFFDLDGTLTDPREGIEKCIVHALRSVGEYREQSNLCSYIGVSLREMFPELMKNPASARVEEAVAAYRERFSEKGLFENRVYPGIPELLAELHEKGYRSFVLTSKPTVFSKRIIEHFGLDQWITAVYGPDLDGSGDNKTELLSRVLLETDIAASRSVVVGDRFVDIDAGLENGCRTIGVTYGFGSREEFSRADAVCETVSKILAAVERLCTGGVL